MPIQFLVYLLIPRDCRKVGQVLFNPAGDNILASASGDLTIKLWDITTGQAPLTLRHSDIVQSLSWNASGDMLVTTSRDKTIRVWDVRQEKPVHEAQGHHGAKNSRTVWMGEHNRFATTGFSKMSERQIALWEPGRSEPIGGFTMIDSISGVCMPFWDEGSNCLYLAGKGDGNIRYYEYENDKFEYLSEYKSADPQRGMAFLPRRGINVHDNEVMRAYKTINDTYIEPISFTVPRRAETFQADIFPPAIGTKPVCGSKDWFNGKTGIPAKIDFESIYDGNAPKEVASEYKPQSVVSSPVKTTPAPKEEPKKEEPKPVATRGPVPSIKDQKSSISNLASKFQDDEEDDDEGDDDETSSFEEISRPAQRTFQPNPKAPVASQPRTPAFATRQSAPITAGPYPDTPAASSTPISKTAPSTASPGSVEASLEQIKALIETQTKVITAQNEKIAQLASEVESLKRKIGSGSQDQSERIRQLELELEQARS